MFTTAMFKVGNVSDVSAREKTEKLETKLREWLLRPDSPLRPLPSHLVDIDFITPEIEGVRSADQFCIVTFHTYMTKRAAEVAVADALLGAVIRPIKITITRQFFSKRPSTSQAA